MGRLRPAFLRIATVFTTKCRDWLLFNRLKGKERNRNSQFSEVEVIAIPGNGEATE